MQNGGGIIAMKANASDKAPVRRRGVYPSMRDRCIEQRALGDYDRGSTTAAPTFVPLFASPFKRRAVLLCVALVLALFERAAFESFFCTRSRRCQLAVLDAARTRPDYVFGGFGKCTGKYNSISKEESAYNRNISVC